MLPVESLRFFWLDRSWLTALVDGALSLGVDSSRTSRYAALTRDVLHDRAWHLTLFEDREKHLLDTLAQRLRGARRAGEAFDAFNGCQEHLLATARAHVHRLVLESFASAIDRC